MSNNDQNFELESHFILRLPAGPAAALRAVVASGVISLKDRFSIQIDQDMRHGQVHFDNWSLPTKMVDLPCVIESHKTLDAKHFYKTADICQMMICKEDDEEEKSDSFEDPKKKDIKDLKKFLWPHGVTPPLKNVRKKRFRKTLKKKFVDVPEIEKEVRRLFKQDNDAISVRYEIVNTEDDRLDNLKPSPLNFSASTSAAVNNTNSQSMDIAEHDLFGEVLSSSDEEDTRAQDTDDASRLSNIRDTSNAAKDDSMTGDLVTEFPKGMLNRDFDMNRSNLSFDLNADNSNAAADAVASLENNSQDVQSTPANDSIMNKLGELSQEITELSQKRQTKEEEILSIENPALAQRFQAMIDSIKKEEMEKRAQYDELLMSTM